MRVYLVVQYLSIPPIYISIVLSDVLVFNKYEFIDVLIISFFSTCDDFISGYFGILTYLTQHKLRPSFLQDRP